jgi:hypothetical protein
MVSRSTAQLRLASSGWKQWYINNAIAIALFAEVFCPELRRIVDWHSSFHALSVLSILPFLTLIPGVYLLPRYLKSMGPLFYKVAIFWIVAFGYGLVMSLMAGNVFAGVFQAFVFVAPLGMASYMAVTQASVIEIFNRVAESTLWIAFVASLYGLAQFIAPAPWDAYWLQSTHIVSMGKAVPFGLHVFGPTSGPAEMGQLAAFAIVMNLSRMTLRKPLQLFALVPIFFALTLTLARICWIFTLVGILVYLLLTPRRATIVKLSASFVLILGIMLTALSQSDAGGAAIDTVSKRFSTFSDLSTDQSFNTRQRIANALPDVVAEAPLGEGLGVTGVAAKLTGGESVIVVDNGYIARLVELGIPGVLFFLIALAIPVLPTFSGLRVAVGQPEYGVIFATAFAVQIMLLVGQSAMDFYLSVPAIFYWLLIAMASELKVKLGTRETVIRAIQV